MKAFLRHAAACVGRSVLACVLCLLLSIPCRTFAWAAALEDATDAYADAAVVSLDDGSYLVDVSMTGGTGRAHISSPADLTVRDSRAVVRIEWSSPNYDYMLVADKRYLPCNEEGNSVFEIPLLAFDEPVAVVGDTTAMSTPHEIEYELTFDEASVRRVDAVADARDVGGALPLAIAGLAAGALAFLAIALARRKARGDCSAR